MPIPHTPGPWEADDIFVGAVDSDGYHVICRGENAYANARAIAALPDLLAALQNLLTDPYLSNPINADRMAESRAAIAKATGA